MVTGDRLLPADAAPQLSVVGAGGMGKTELLERAAAELAELGRPVCRCSGRRLEQDEAFGGLADLFEALGLDVPDSERTARQVLLDRLSGSTLVVDDAQWLDDSSLRVLVAVAERAPEYDLGVVVAHRPQLARNELAVLDAVLSRRSPVLHLRPLSRDQVSARVAAALGRPVARDLVDALLLRTEGIPAYVDRLLHAWVAAAVVEDGRLARDPAESLMACALAVEHQVSELPELPAAVLTALAVATAVEDDVLAEVLEVSAAEMNQARDVLGSAGFLSPVRRGLVPLVAEAIDSLTPLGAQRELHAQLARVLRGRGVPAGRVAEHLLAARRTGPDVIEAFVAAGDDALIDDPDIACTWYRHAVDAGADRGGLAARWAEAAARAGELTEALRLAETAAAATHAAERCRGLTVLAAVLPAAGRWHRSGELFGSLAGDGDAAAALGAVPGLVAAGDAATARTRLADAAKALEGAAPLTTTVARLVAEGALAAATTERTVALARFYEAAELLDALGRINLLPDTPHALGAVTAMAALAMRPADELLRRAASNDAGGPAYVVRHRLLQGWSAMRTGHFAAAEQALEVESASLRDELLAVALEAGLARRTADVARLGAAWERARAVLLRHPADLWCLDAVGELVVTAARLGQPEVVEGHLRALDRILAQLDHPGLWEATLHWHQLQAALTQDDGPAVERHAKELSSAAAAEPSVLPLATAAAAWSKVVQNAVDPELVHAGAEDLDAIGLGWDAARLTGAAAARATDRALTRSLFEQAREMRSALPIEADGGTEGVVLSEREREVAELVAAGLTHKEIGAQLFISPKTVEHHVARIRHRVGATTRAELLAELRVQLARD